MSSGFTRASYGEGEQFAHDLIAETGARAGPCGHDRCRPAIFMSRSKGREPDKGTFLIGSHLDTVPQGGNFDGAAGVLAGMAVLSVLAQAPASRRPATWRSWRSAPRKAPGFRIPISARRRRSGCCRRPRWTSRAPIPAARWRSTWLSSAAIRTRCAAASRICKPRGPSRLCGAAYRAGAGAGRRGHSARAGHRHPRQLPLPRRARHRRIRPFRRGAARLSA